LSKSHVDPREAVKPRDQKHVAVGKLREGAAKLRAVGARAARRLHLRVNAPAVGRNARVAIDHAAPSMVLISARTAASKDGRQQGRQMFLRRAPHIRFRHVVVLMPVEVQTS
jgi:hypothetical protein